MVNNPSTGKSCRHVNQKVCEPRRPHLSGRTTSPKRLWVTQLPGERPTVEAAGGGKLTLYGYGRLDLISSDRRLSNTVVPFFISPEGGPGSVPVNDGQFNTNVRLTRPNAS
jgi:hypothetical protein